jgi:hypothetical protein
MARQPKRKFKTSTFVVGDQRCRIFLEPLHEYTPGHWLWGVGFVVGGSPRQQRDWYWKRKNKRRRKLDKKLLGNQGIKTIIAGFNEVLRIRWNIEGGDVLFLDCTSAKPEQQFKTWSRWHRHHPEWVIDFHEKKFFWYRPPYSDDTIREQFDVTPIIPADPLANTAGSRYYDCFCVRPKGNSKELSNDQITNLLSMVLAN